MVQYKSFNSSRDEFKPYGLTCERWIPRLMPRIDRHNEIEINFVRSGSISYFFRDRIVTIPEGKIALFWGLVPHRIVKFEQEDFYFVCTIPLAMFLQWRLPDRMENHIFSGKVLIDTSRGSAQYDNHRFEQWEKDISTHPDHRASILEIQARMLRLADNYTMIAETGVATTSITNKIEIMSLFIARNYTEKLTAKSIADSAGISADHANVLFNKTFGHSLMRQVLIERINHAQRELLFTDDPVSQIALDCGFNSISCFNSAFSKLNGCSPTTFRKTYNKII